MYLYNVSQQILMCSVNFNSGNAYYLCVFRFANHLIAASVQLART